MAGKEEKVMTRDDLDAFWAKLKGWFVKAPTTAVTANTVAVFDGTTGKVIKSSGYTIGTSVPANALFTDTTYESKAAASGGTAVSLVTTGEKYIWNSKAAGDHTHQLSFSSTSGNPSVILSANTKYQIKAGGSELIVMTPPDTWRDITDIYNPDGVGSSSVSLSQKGAQDMLAIIGQNTLTDIAWSSNKLTKTKNGTTSDVVSISTIKTALALTKSDVGLGSVGNFLAVSTDANQGLTDTQKSNARANIGAGTSNLTIGTTSTTAAAGNHTHSEYLPKTGGIIYSSGSDTPLTIKTGSDSADSAGIAFMDHNSTQFGNLVAAKDVGLFFSLSNQGGTNTYTVLHSGNSSVSLSGSTLTVTINGVSKSLTDTNTTYSAGTGLSLSGTTFNHSNSVTAQTTQALYPIKIDAQGHISGYGSAVTSLPASDVYAWAKAATKPSYSFSEISGKATNAQLQNASITISGVGVDLGGSISQASLRTGLGLDTSAYKAFDTVVTQNSANLITSGAVWTAIDNLPEPMVFKGSLGTGGTITSLPTNGSASIGDTYKVITAGTYASKAAKVGDTFICLTKTSSANTWELIPSGDEPSGTVTSVGLSMPTGFSVSSSPVTSSGTLTVAFASGYSLPTTAKQSNWDTAYNNSHTHSNKSVLDGITSTNVSNWGTAYTNSHTHSNKSVLDGITSTKVSNWDTAYGWGNHASAGYALASSLSNYLPKTGGVIYSQNNDTPLTIKTGSTSNTAGLAFMDSNSTQFGALYATKDVGLYFALSNQAGTTTYTVLHSGNSSVSLSGSTLTVKINGVEKSLTNTNTTYSAGTGISLSGTTFSNSGVRSTTINGNYLRVNTDGTNADLTIPYAASAGSVAWSNVSGKPSFATVATSGSYNDLSNKPTIPSVSNATITIKQTGISDQTFTLNGSATTITLADTNTWRPLGTGASDACAGNDSRLSNARPASDVSAWAKKSSLEMSITSGSSPSPIGLAFGTQYALNAGGSALYFTMPALGTTGTTACAGNDSRLSNARPASDVYAWAKASTKPSYSFSEISDRYQSLIDWGGPNLVGSVSPLEVATIDDLGHNKFAFASAGTVEVQYSRDGGSSWSTYSLTDNDRRSLVTLTSALCIGARTGSSNTVNDKLRVILNTAYLAGGNIYMNLRRLLLYISTSGSGGCTVKVEHRTIGNYKAGSNTWSEIGTYGLEGWSGWNSIPCSVVFGGSSYQTSQSAQVRLTFGVTSVSSTYSNLTLYAIRGIGFPLWSSPSTMASTGHLYSYDISQNAAFPAGVSATSFTENGTALSSKYLGISAKAADSDKLDGNDSSYYLNYNNLNNKPTIPSVSNATITIKQTGISDQTFTLNGSATTITLADTNTWRPLGTGASDACAGNDSRLSNARPASDVYSWAKAANINLTLAPSSSTGTVAQLSAASQYCLTVGNSTFYFYTPNDTTYSAATTSAAGLMSAADKTKLNGIATGATAVSESTVSGWGFTKNTGTVTSVKVGSTSYSPSSGIVSLPAYPTTLPASDVSAWAKKSSLEMSITSGSSQSPVGFAFGTQYALNAGGSALYFTMPALGTTGTTACAGNDSRLSDARTPVAHASSATTYGAGTTANYGHVKLATGDMNGASGADGVACGKNHTHSQYLPLTGGTVGDGSTNNPLTIYGKASEGSFLKFACPHSGTAGQNESILGIDPDGNFWVNPNSTTAYVLLHSGNIGSYKGLETTTFSGTSLSCSVDTYYRASATINTLAVTLPAVSGSTTRSILLYLTTGTSPNITFTGQSGITVKYYASHYIQANKTYEINALYNGSIWIVSSAEVL